MSLISATTSLPGNLAKPKYDITLMTLGEMLFVMAEHFLTFETMRGMTIAEITATFEGINDGTIKSVKEETLKQKQMREVAPKK